MRRLAIMLAAVAFAGAGGTAMAEDWGGFHVGLAGGLVGGHLHAAPVPGCGCDPFNIPLSGAFGGVVAGYDFTLGRVVLGVEADASASNADGTAVDHPYPSLTTTGKLTWFTTLRARVGLPVGRFMPFVSAGVAYGHVEAGYHPTLEGGEASGFAGGIGVEFKATRNIVLRAEYLRLNLKDVTVNLGSGVPQADIDTRSNLFRIGLSFKFGG